MTVSRRHFLQLSAAALTLAGAGQALAWQAPAAEQLPAVNDPALHMLNRISWGVRPQDVARARAIGIEAYLDEQLAPESLDDPVMDALLETMPILQMDRRTAHRLQGREYRCYMALVKGMVLRAVYSERQLLERMVEFWSDHFNIAASDYSPDVVVFQREVIRQHALGNFRDLLFGSAQSPAMLYYLDNYLNVAEHPNENYARELLELHTLGVDGGYTEDDVKEVARAFTGWTVHDGVDDGFHFDPSVHDTDEKVVLGHTLPAGRGIEDALHVLSIVNGHPATARFICYKLCVRFVSDTPPQSLVDSAAAVWMEQRGAIRPVLRHILLSPEFMHSAGQKLRRPLDFFIGALRATGTEFLEFWTMDALLNDLAQVPYGWHPPDGYPDTAAAWTSTSGLLARWNTAFTLTHGALSDRDLLLTTQLRERIGEPATVGALVDAVSAQVFGLSLPSPARDVFVAFVAEDAPGGADAPVSTHLLAGKLGMLYGLLLASPLYQWR